MSTFDSSATIKFDPNDMTIDEAITFEQIAGVAVDKIGDVNTPKAPIMKALVYLAAYRMDPTVTPDQVGGMKITDVADMLVVAEPLSPSDGD